MTPGEIEADKQAWFRAWNMLRTLSRGQIIKELDMMTDAEREDMKRRLNTIKENRKLKK